MHNEQKIRDSIYWIGGNDFITPRFDNYIPLNKGISYNTYFIDDEKTCVLDAIDNTVRDLFMENVRRLLHGRKLDYIIVNHIEPDHSGSLMELARAYPKAKICATPQALKMFEQYFHDPLPERYIRTDEKLVIDLGRHKLRFITAPMVHWPEVTFTYEETEKILFSADAFGTFGALNGNLFADEVAFDEEYLEGSRYYYMNVVSKYGVQVLSVLKKVAGFDVQMICPLHGPLYRTAEDISKMVALYKKMATWGYDYKSVTVFFASGYGNTAMAAQRMAFLLSEKGVTRLKLVDLCSIPLSIAWTQVARRSHMILAAPTLNMGIHPSMAAFLHECSAMGMQNRVISIMGNSSWAPNVSGKKMKEIAEGWKNCRILGETIHISSAMGDREEREMEELAELIAADVKE